jgi:hypothetical protein
LTALVWYSFLQIQGTTVRLSLAITPFSALDGLSVALHPEAPPGLQGWWRKRLGHLITRFWGTRRLECLRVPATDSLGEREL